MMNENRNNLKCILIELYHLGIAWVQIGSHESAERKNNYSIFPSLYFED